MFLFHKHAGFVPMLVNLSGGHSCMAQSKQSTCCYTQAQLRMIACRLRTQMVHGTKFDGRMMQPHDNLPSHQGMLSSLGY